MNKKYKLLKNQSIKVGEATLYRIQALRDFGDVKKGDVGGYIQSHRNLYHDGKAWVFDDAKVFGNASVSGDASINHGAKAYGNAKIYGNAIVFGDADVSGRIWISGNAKIFGNAKVNGGVIIGNSPTINFDVDNSKPYCFVSLPNEGGVRHVTLTVNYDASVINYCSDSIEIEQLQKFNPLAASFVVLWASRPR